MNLDAQPPIYPPPTMLPPPAPSPKSNRSNFSSSNRKRKREGTGAGAAPGSSYAASSASSGLEFSQTTETKVARIDYGDTCWHCGARPADTCRVLRRNDRSFPQLVQKGLITFDHLGHADNAIPLCPNCHRNFDDINQPGLVFLPSDLQYFIDFEKADFIHRETRARDTSSVPQRTCPTPQMYLEHQLQTGAAPEDACGGLYLRYTLYDYFFKLGPKNTWIPGLGPFQEPESWHGAPMAALWRAFLILGNPLSGIADQEKRMLRELQDLYQRQIPKNSSIRTGANAEGDRGCGERQGQEHPSDQDAPCHHDPNFPAQAPNDNRYADGSTDAEANLADSAIDLAFEMSRPGQGQDRDSGGALTRQQTTKLNDATTTKHGSRRQAQTRTTDAHVKPSFALSRHRPRSPPQQQIWTWGPLSSSESNASWYSTVTGWTKDSISAEVGTSVEIPYCVLCNLAVCPMLNVTFVIRRRAIALSARGDEHNRGWRRDLGRVCSCYKD